MILCHVLLQPCPGLHLSTHDAGLPVAHGTWSCAPPTVSWPAAGRSGDSALDPGGSTADIEKTSLIISSPLRLLPAPRAEGADIGKRRESWHRERTTES